MIRCALCNDIIDAKYDIEDYLVKNPDGTASPVTGCPRCGGEVGMLCDKCGEDNKDEKPL